MTPAASETSGVTGADEHDLAGSRPGESSRSAGSERTRKRWTLVAVTLGLGITILDETVVFLALPAIDRDLGVGLAGQQWVVNGYLLPLSALLLVAGSLADRYGRRRLSAGDATHHEPDQP